MRGPGAPRPAGAGGRVSGPDPGGSPDTASPLVRAAAPELPGKRPAGAGGGATWTRDDLETATAQWVNWYNRTRPHRANPDDLSPAAAEHRYHRNHTTTAAAPATA